MNYRWKVIQQAKQDKFPFNKKQDSREEPVISSPTSEYSTIS